MPGEWDYQNHDVFQSPRYVPDSSGPWTPYSSIYYQNREPSPAENLFAPGQSPIREARRSFRGLPRVGHFQSENGGIAYQNEHVQNLDDDDEDGDDAIGRPPSSNPFGPPLDAQVSAVCARNIKKKGGGVGKPNTRAKACWHCKMLRISVCGHAFLDMRKTSNGG